MAQRLAAPAARPRVPLDYARLSQCPSFHTYTQAHASNLREVALCDSVVFVESVVFDFLVASLGTPQRIYSKHIRNQGPFQR
jgi:hypothetical protein